MVIHAIAKTAVEGIGLINLIVGVNALLDRNAAIGGPLTILGLSLLFLEHNLEY
jgi:hypothetical protein